jgi:hypothetical protein
MSAIPGAVRAIVLKRADGHCEGCGLFGPTELHHRMFRSRGGKHDVSNLIALHGSGNHSGCHGTAHSGYIGESLGWSIRSGFDPLLVPVFRRVDATWWRFDDDGGKEQINALTAIEYLVLIGAIREGVMR